jgi:hypothetical protein
MYLCGTSFHATSSFIESGHPLDERTSLPTTTIKKILRAIYLPDFKSALCDVFAQTTMLRS